MATIENTVTNVWRRKIYISWCSMIFIYLFNMYVEPPVGAKNYDRPIGISREHNEQGPSLMLLINYLWSCLLQGVTMRGWRPPHPTSAPHILKASWFITQLTDSDLSNSPANSDWAGGYRGSQYPSCYRWNHFRSISCLHGLPFWSCLAIWLVVASQTQDIVTFANNPWVPGLPALSHPSSFHVTLTCYIFELPF